MGLTSLRSSFPFARRRGTSERHCTQQGVDKSTFFVFCHYAPQTSLCIALSKNKKMSLCDISLLRLFCSGGRWGCCSPIKILTTSIYRPFQPLFFTIWSHIGLRKIVPCICKSSLNLSPSKVYSKVSST